MNQVHKVKKENNYYNSLRSRKISYIDHKVLFCPKKHGIGHVVVLDKIEQEKPYLKKIEK